MPAQDSLTSFSTVKQPLDFLFSNGAHSVPSVRYRAMKSGQGSCYYSVISRFYVVSVSICPLECSVLASCSLYCYNPCDQYCTLYQCEIEETVALNQLPQNSCHEKISPKL